MTLYALDGIEPQLPADGSAWVAPGAAVMGNVRLQRQSSVWFNAVIRGDNELIDIGERSNIQDMAMLHTDLGFPMVIGPDCTIGHKAILHGCIIGEGSLIGMGATILNGAKIGRHCIVGANALVAEGKEIPDFSLVVGIPGKVARTLGPETEERLRASAAWYVKNAARFSAGLKAIG